jgi:hypothetical protein
MARCDVEGCDWYGKASGLAIHKARAHDIHPIHEELEECSNTLEDSSEYSNERLMEPIISRWSP